MLSTIQAHLSEHVGRADLRLFEAICARAPSDLDANQITLHLGKAQVLAALREIEGKDVSLEVVRSRIRHLNAALIAIGRDVYGLEGAIMTISSRKDRIVLNLSPAAAELIETDKIKKAVAEAAQQDKTFEEGDLVESRIAISTYQIMISHGWEGGAVDDILKQFVNKLKGKFEHFPQRFRDQFAVRVWVDYEDMHPRSTFEEQADKACEGSAFAIFITNDKWFDSEPCKREYQHFAKRRLPDGVRPFLLIQLSGDPADQDAEFRSQPCLPLWWKSEFKTLLELWEKGYEADKDNFTTCVRKEICEHLEKFGGPVTDPEPTGKRQPISAPRLRDIDFTKASMFRDIPEEQTIETKFLSEDKNNPDEREAAENSIPALPYLEDWAKDPTAKHRVLAILGGFGMGKTVIVQRLADKLFRDGNGPTPIYLDFRRLIPTANPGQPIRSELSDIILQTIGGEAAKRINAEKLIAMIRSEPCVVILDGLDEIGNRIGRDHTTALYRQLLELIPREAWQADSENKGTPDWKACPTRLIVTCRTHFFRSFAEEQSTFALGDRGDRRLRASIHTLHMAPLTMEAIQQLFIKSLGEEEGQRTLQTIQTIHDLPGLARRPIMARYISEIAGSLLLRHQAGDVINIATIYEELFNRGLERDSEKRQALTSSDRVDILKALALHLHQQGAQTMDIASLEGWFDRFAANHTGIELILKSGGIGARGLLQTELRNASFLVRIHNDRFVFAHTSFFEYFLGLVLADAVLAGNVSALANHPLSRETIEFCFAAVKQKNLEEEFDRALIGRITSDDPKEDRALIWRLMRFEGGEVVAPPSGANLSGLDLRDLRLKPGAVWHCINLEQAVLTGLKARDVVFQNVAFDKAFIGDAQFEGCRFIHCSGRTHGGRSARLWQGHCDSASASIFADTLFRWPIEGAASLPIEINDCHAYIITSVAFAPDGATLLTGSDDGIARLWDIETGTEIRRFEGHEAGILGGVQSVAFAPDGATLLTGGCDGTARLWDIENGAEIRHFKGHGDWIASVAFVPNGARLLAGSCHGTARLWDIETGAEICCFEGHKAAILGGVHSAAFALDGATLLTGSGTGTARLWDIANGAEIRRFEGHKDGVSSVAFAPDGVMLLTGSRDGTARLWDTASGAEIHCFEGHKDGVLSVAFAPDGVTLITGSRDWTARLWDIKTGAEIRRFDGHEGWVQSVAFAPNGATLLTGSGDGTAGLWDIATSAEIRRFKGHKRRIQSVAFAPDGATLITSSLDSVAFAPDGATLITGSLDRTARLWDIENGAEIRRFKGHGDWIASVAFAPDGVTLLTGSLDRTARLWDIENGAEIRRFKGHGDGIASVAFAPDGATLITGSYDRTARLWDTETGAEIRRFEGHQGGIVSVTFAPDGATLLTGSRDRTARLWDIKTGAEIRRFKGHEGGLGGGIESVTFAPDGATLITVDNDRTACLWDTAIGAEIRRFEGHQGGILSITFAPNGATLLTGSHDGTARLWNTETGAEIRRFEGHKDRVSSVAFAPDGATLITGSHDGTVRLWNVATGMLKYEIIPLPDSWLVRSSDQKVIRHGPNLWRYAYSLIPSKNGLPRVTVPDEESLLRLEVK